MIGAGGLAARETLLMSGSTNKVPQQTRQISTMVERIGKRIGEKRGYMYHSRTKATIMTPKPAAVDPNTFPLHPQVEGRITEEKRRGLNNSPQSLIVGTVVVRWTRPTY